MCLQEELRANKGKKIDDPFTRRSTKPRMSYKAEIEEYEAMEAMKEVESVKLIQAGMSMRREVEQEEKKKPCAQDLFNAHDFDITIDLEVPVASEYFSNLIL